MRMLRTAEAMLHARAEPEDLKETIGRLERLVLEQGTELRGETRRLHDDVRHLHKGDGSGEPGSEA
jgi:hypothetical protein